MTTTLHACLPSGVSWLATLPRLVTLQMVSHILVTGLGAKKAGRASKPPGMCLYTPLLYLSMPWSLMQDRSMMYQGRCFSSRSSLLMCITPGTCLYLQLDEIVWHLCSLDSLMLQHILCHGQCFNRRSSHLMWITPNTCFCVHKFLGPNDRSISQNADNNDDHNVHFCCNNSQTRRNKMMNQAWQRSKS